MTEKPSYFEQISRKAASRWDQLEQDPELAGPWHQLFKQVQSPRHVLSELLQNADDAEATEASVKIDNGEFIFSHNGEDFIEEHFSSICRFGYSNKRALHTIGFRGIGFKSTFSLGDKVCLVTPSLSVAFHRERFTEPVWVKRNKKVLKQTEIRVTVQDEYRLLELNKNLQEWVKSPASLLFFRKIRCLRIGDEEVRWISNGPGPVSDSEWFSLSNNPGIKHLLLRSTPEDFPEDTLEEIRQERMISNDEETSYPPCRVEIVLGMEGRLYVILPTGVMTDLPFASNAPFIQDPARVKIKDPDISPTNRWLLRRVGNLAAVGMLAWLRRDDIDVESRCEAYSIFPDVDRDDDSIEGSCNSIVEEAFEEAIDDENFLLTEDGSLKSGGGCISIPSKVLDVWTSCQLAHFFDDDGLSILSRHISSDNLQKLVNWEYIEERGKLEILNLLQSKHLPLPDSWTQLLTLWAYVASDGPNYRYYNIHREMRIIPVQGKDVLYAASEVVRLGEKRLLQSEEDWNFLSKYLLVVNQNWPRFMAKQRRKAEEGESEQLIDQIEAAYEVLDGLGLDQTSDVNHVIDQVAKEVYEQDNCPLVDCVRLAQLAAKLGTSVLDNFQFVTCDRTLRCIDECDIVADIDRNLDVFVEDDWYERYVLHGDYWKKFLSCTETEWQQWISSGRSKLLTFVPLLQTQEYVWGRPRLSKLLSERGHDDEPNYRYVTDSFVIDDWDFDEELWLYWESQAEEDDEFWGSLFARIIEQSDDYWSKKLSAKASQIATTGTKALITYEDILPSWIVKFSGLPCLKDTRGFFRQPVDLLRRTPETESLLDVEPFVHAEYDTEHTRPLLIKLGMRDTPTGPGRLIDRLRALATSDNPPVYEVEKWYHRLDQMIDKCPTDELYQIRLAFINNEIILTERCNWVRSIEVFLSQDEECVPGAAIIHPSVKHLTLWNKIGVAERPSVDLALEWLQDLTTEQKLSQDELRRVRSLLPKLAFRIWDECKHWLNLQGEWTHVKSFEYRLTMQSLIPWRNLLPHVLQKTADFQRLSAETCQQYPFSCLSNIAGVIEFRFQDELYDLPDQEQKPWLQALGSGLARVELDDEDKTLSIWELADRMKNTYWQTVSNLKTVPYINGVPAGTPRSIDALWKEEVLYVEDRPFPQLFKPITQELTRPFDRQDISEAIKACIERPAGFILEYLEENFTLLPPDEVKHESEKKDKSNYVKDAELEPQCDEDQTYPETQQDPEVEIPKDIEDVTFEEESVGEDHEFFEEEETENNSNLTERKHSEPTKPTLIERFAKALGYKVDDCGDRFYHADGSWIEKVSGSSFPWERRSPSGELTQCYWIKDHCLQLRPLQLDAEIWELCDKNPDKYTLLLTDPADAPIELSGHRLRKFCDNGKLTLYPAKYSLVYDQDKKEDAND